MFVTALICNYNYESFLAEAIDSALNQTWKHMEVIVVDDGSTDNSREIINSYGRKIRAIFKENGGQASAFNAGIAAANGDIICFLDSDDIWLEKKVEYVVQSFRKFPWALNCHDLSVIDEHGSNLPETTVHFTRPCSQILDDPFDLVQKNGYRWMFRPTSALSVRADVAKSIVPIPEEDWRISADSPLAFSATCAGPVFFIQANLGSYRIHGENRYATSQLASTDDHFIRNLIRPIERYLFLKNCEPCKHQGPMLHPNNFYPEYRKRVFIAHPRPATMLTKLVVSNFSFFICRSNGFIRPWLMFFRYLMLDFLITLMITISLPFRYTRLRKKFKEYPKKISPDIMQCLFAE